MASNRRADWIRARDDYLDQLDRRFPDNRYKKQTQKWRDRILFDESEVLNSNAARQFVIHYTAAAEASDRGDYAAATRQLQELEGLLKSVSNDPKKRKWYLLALNRTESLENANRRQFVEKQLQIADEALRSGRREEAIVIRKKLVEQYGKFRDLADLFPEAPPSGRNSPE